MRANIAKGIAVFAVITGLAHFSGKILAHDEERLVRYYVDSLFFIENFDSDEAEEWRQPDSATVSIDTIGHWGGQLVIEVIYVGFESDWCEEGKAILLESGQHKIELLYFYINDCTEVFLKPAKIVEVDSVSVLFTRDPITGTGGYVEEKYWIWSYSANRPVELKHHAVTTDALMQILPEGYCLAYGGFFDINGLSLEGYVRRPGDYNCCPTGGWITLEYGIENSSLQVISWTYDPDKIDSGTDSKPNE